jgi:hypothetical protein
MSYDSSSLPVPDWTDLPEYARSALTKVGYDKVWSPELSLSDDHRLTVLNLFVKLAGMRLWSFIGAPIGYSVGTLEFRAATIAGLRTKLSSIGDFATPDKNLDDWDSREYRVSGSLHFKHNKDWSPVFRLALC